jgi:penicillin-binding protein 2
MFERRAKIFLAILIVLAIVLAVRAAQVQLVNHGYWNEQAVHVMTRPELIETTRGRILDRKGNVMAEDLACIDACVDYRAIPTEADEDWVHDVALARLKNRMGSDFTRADKQQHDQLLQNEIAAVRSDIRKMWDVLARLGKIPAEQIDELRQGIVRRVEMRRRFVWYHKYETALKYEENREPSPWYKRWLIDQTQAAPQLDQFDVVVAEQTQPHVILSNIDNDTNNFLGKHIDDFPGLVLQPSMYRVYPYKDVAAHLIGHLAKVSQDDLRHDPNMGKELREYWPNDLIGKGGLEALCEQSLRGTRGRIERYFGDDNHIVGNVAAIAGQDVRSTIDMDLQQEVQNAFAAVVIKHEGQPDDPPLAMPGAAVVIKIDSGEVLAMASYPSYDPNTLDHDYPQLLSRELDVPLMNRATQFALEPGSTAKPMVGLGAVTDGKLALNGTIECTGYLVLDGHKYLDHRCWVASMFGEALHGNVAHHPTPPNDPHPTGFLTFSDGLQRSCNVFFETLADRQGMDRLGYWYGQFGLGRKTGVGIDEVPGLVPGDVPVPAITHRAAVWSSGIGQQFVLATPIQMANAVATIARRGIWMRPTLLPRDLDSENSPQKNSDVVDLHLNPVAIDQAWDGMTRVVNTIAGTGKNLHMDDLLVAGKTGSAQAAILKIPRRDEHGKLIQKIIQVPVEDANGKISMEQRTVPDWETIEPGTAQNPNPLAPWYRAYGDKPTYSTTGPDQDKLVHAWVIGFAPADNPKIAFAVFVEYGGSGGIAAATVGKQVLAACIAHGYLQKDARVVPYNQLPK